jgi:hypothetical protein
MFYHAGRRLAVFACLVVSLSHAASARQFRSVEGRFTVIVPSNPVRQVVPGDGYSQIQYVSEMPNGAVVVSFQDNEELVHVSDAKRDQALRAGRDALANTFGGRVIADKVLRFQNRYPSRYYVAEVPAMHGFARAQLFLVSGRLYQIMVVGTKEFVFSRSADMVFESFKTAY